MQKLIYLIRWWVSALVMLPLMNYLQDLPLRQNLMIGQTFGAIVFYNVDKLIFKKDFKKKEPKAEIETEIIL